MRVTLADGDTVGGLFLAGTGLGFATLLASTSLERFLSTVAVDGRIICFFFGVKAVPLPLSEMGCQASPLLTDPLDQRSFSPFVIIILR